MAEEAVRTIEVVQAELQSLGIQMGPLYENGDFAAAQALQAQAQKLHKELTQLSSRAAQTRVLSEIRISFETPIREALEMVLEDSEFVSGPLAKAIEGGFTSYTVVVTLPRDEQELAINGRFGGGAQVRERNESAPRAPGGPRAQAVIVDGVRYDTKISLAETLGNEKEKASVAANRNYGGHIATAILKRYEAEGGHTVEYVTAD